MDVHLQCLMFECFLLYITGFFFGNIKFLTLVLLKKKLRENNKFFEEDSGSQDPVS